MVGERKPDSVKNKTELSPELREVENQLRQLVGTKVTLRPAKNGSGSINIHYYSAEDLEAIIEKLSNH